MSSSSKSSSHHCATTGSTFFSITTISKNLLTPHPTAQSVSAVEPDLNLQTINDLDRRISLNELTTIRWNLQEDLDAYREWNLPAIGISWRKLQDFGVQKGVRLIRDAGLPVSSIGWVGGFTGQNGFGLDEALLEAKRVIRVAGQLKASTVTVVTGSQNGHIDSHALRLVTIALSELAALADCYGTTISLQPMHPIFRKNWSFLHGLDETLELLRRVNHPSLRLALGIYHLGDEQNLFEKIPSIWELIGLVQLSDRSAYPHHENDRMLPGAGALPIERIISVLESAGYDGWYETEVWSRDLWKLDHHDLIGLCLESQSKLITKTCLRLV